MKKVILLIGFLTLIAINANSQNFIFRRSGPYTVNGFVSSTDPTIVKFILKNTATTTQNFKIARVYRNFPSGWQITLCTYISCFGDVEIIPPDPEHYPLSPNQVDTIAVDFYGEIPGTGKLTYKAYVEGNPSVYIQDSVMVVLQSTSVSQISSFVKDYELKQNYPNPFNPTTSIEFSLHKNSDVNLIVYDLQGKEVARLLDNRKLEQGSYKYDFNSNEFNLSSGAYFYKLVTGDFISTKKMLLIK